MDKHFRIEVISAMDKPQTAVWAAMHQDYSEGFVWDQREKFPNETKAGELCVKHLLKGGRGHYGPCEGPSIILNVGGFPHSTMQQLRTHRVGLSFDVQSMRYTGQRIVDLSNTIQLKKEKGESFVEDIEEVFYIRPTGEYADRFGKKYDFTQVQRVNDLLLCGQSAIAYADHIHAGMSEEHARSILCFDFRQNFVLSCNIRSLMHLLDLRWKKDAQLECQWFCDLLFLRFFDWCPQIAEWYSLNRAKKARLSP